ncbi:MAG TPA: hypothetical protein VJN21_04885 [Candidatus Acidoferrales bacterium]|nr:hypothetical protein [Candidatus Acidoferrales bacterium]
MLDRRRFLKWAVASAALPSHVLRAAQPARSSSASGAPPVSASTPSEAQPKAAPQHSYAPRRIPNEYSLLLPGEAEALAHAPGVSDIQSETLLASANGRNPAPRRMRVGEELDGWRLVARIPWLNGTPTAVFEKHVTHRGVIVYVTESGELERIPKSIGDLANIRPRPINAEPGKEFVRHASFPAQPDAPGDYILNSSEDPCYENVAALGPEFIGWTLVANEESGPGKSLWLEADGKSRQLESNPQFSWAPDLTGRLFDPTRFLPSEYLYDYVPGYSKRTLLGGYLPVADVGVWNPSFKLGYEAMVLLPAGADAKLIGRIRALLPEEKNSLIPAGDTSADQKLPPSRWVDRYWNGSAEDFFSALAGIWNHWRHFFEDRMRVEIPDPWLLDAARAGIVLSRCSYHGLEPTYQIGEGAYTKIPVRSHALFPVAHYEFVWAHQLWNLTNEVEPYFEHYLNSYILPDGNFLYNTQDQVEAPLNAGVFLENSARAYDFSGDLDAFERRLPVLRRMIDYVLKRYRYSLEKFPEDDPRHGLIWGSPEADLGDPQNDYPESHPWFYQNAAWIWRGLYEHQRALARAAKAAETSGSSQLAQDLASESAEVQRLAAEMRVKIERSLKLTLDARNPEMKTSGITPFHPFDTKHKRGDLSSYENHRFMMDWWPADWGDAALDEGHFLHRAAAGEQLLGMNTDGHYPRTSNFMEHGTLAGRIRQDDYRPFLLALYGNLCYAMDSGNRYAPEDALLPGNYPGEGSPYAWSAVVNSELQPTLALRWLLCYEEHDRASGPATVHLQKAAPKHWFADGKRIEVQDSPTRFGPLSWKTESGAGRWRVEIHLPETFTADLLVHIHPPDGQVLRTTSIGQIAGDAVRLTASTLEGKRQLSLEIA